MRTTILLVGLGGCIGSILRYLTAVWFTRHFTLSAIPYGTLAVNFLGCFVIGIVYGLSDHFHWMTNQWRLFLATGVCGGFTTFSTFTYENLSMLQHSDYSGFFIYTILSFSVCLLAVFAGVTLLKIF